MSESLTPEEIAERIDIRGQCPYQNKFDQDACDGGNCQCKDDAQKFRMPAADLIRAQSRHIAELSNELSHVTRQRDDVAEKLRVANDKIQRITFGDNRQRQQSETTTPRAPDGYAYRYASTWADGGMLPGNSSVICFERRADHQPLEVIPYFYGSPPTQQPLPTEEANSTAQELADSHAAYELLFKQNGRMRTLLLEGQRLHCETPLAGQPYPDYACGKCWTCRSRALLATLSTAQQACTGKNCGSTDPKYHSAECFAEHEKITAVPPKEYMSREDANMLATELIVAARVDDRASDQYTQAEIMAAKEKIVLALSNGAYPFDIDSSDQETFRVWRRFGLTDEWLARCLRGQAKVEAAKQPAEPLVGRMNGPIKRMSPPDESFFDEPQTTQGHWYVEELADTVWTRHPLAHNWENKLDAEKQLAGFIKRGEIRLLRVVAETGESHD